MPVILLKRERLSRHKTRHSGGSISELTFNSNLDSCFTLPKLEVDLHRIKLWFIFKSNLVLNLPMETYVLVILKTSHGSYYQDHANSQAKYKNPS